MYKAHQPNTGRIPFLGQDTRQQLVVWRVRCVCASGQTVEVEMGDHV
jgi:hypothetical protein